MKLLWLVVALSSAGKRTKEEKVWYQTELTWDFTPYFQRKDRLNKKAQKLGYSNADEMIEKTKSNEISPWLAEVYGKKRDFYVTHQCCKN